MVDSSNLASAFKYIWPLMTKRHEMTRERV